MTAREADAAIEKIRQSPIYKLDADIRALVAAWDRGDMGEYDNLTRKILGRMSKGTASVEGQGGIIS